MKEVDLFKFGYRFDIVIFDIMYKEKDTSHPELQLVETELPTYNSI